MATENPPDDRRHDVTSVPRNGTPVVARRRGNALEQAIFDAVWDLLAQSGYDELSMAAVATRARTSKPVLYRRWPNRAELVLATVRNKVPPPRFPRTDHGDLRADLIALLRPLTTWLEGTPPDIVRSLRTAVLNDPELARATQTRMAQLDLTPALTAILTRAAARGEVTGNPIPPRVIHLPVQLMRTESLRTMPVPDEAVIEIVDQILVPLLSAL